MGRLSTHIQNDAFNRFLPENPHIKFFESRERGSVLVDLASELLRTDLRVVNTITQARSEGVLLDAAPDGMFDEARDLGAGLAPGSSLGVHTPSILRHRSMASRAPGAE